MRTIGVSPMASRIVSQIGLNAASVSIIPGANRRDRRPIASPAVSNCGTLSSARGDLFSISGRGRRHQRREQPARRRSHFVDRAVERGFIGLRWLGVAADLAHELQRRGPDFILCRRRFEVEERFYVTAHDFGFQSPVVVITHWSRGPTSLFASEAPPAAAAAALFPLRGG